MNIEAENLDSLRKLVRELQAENTVLKEKLKNHNLPKSEDARQPQVTPEKEAEIMKAFKHFGVI